MRSYTVHWRRFIADATTGVVGAIVGIAWLAASLVGMLAGLFIVVGAIGLLVIGWRALFS